MWAPAPYIVSKIASTWLPMVTASVQVRTTTRSLRYATDVGVPLAQLEVASIFIAPLTSSSQAITSVSVAVPASVAPPDASAATSAPTTTVAVVDRRAATRMRRGDRVCMVGVPSCA